jgi:hypothetical protein
MKPRGAASGTGLGGRSPGNLGGKTLVIQNPNHSEGTGAITGSSVDIVSDFSVRQPVLRQFVIRQ